jgi:hypothetical protein
MILEILILILGIIIGLNWRHEKDMSSYNKTYEQLDEKLRRDLAIAQNLVESLKQDKNELQQQVWKLNKEKQNVKTN